MHRLETPVITQFVRIWPTSWHNAIALRVEFYVNSIGRPVGLSTNVVPDSCLSASSVRGGDTCAHYGRWQETRGVGAWIPGLGTPSPTTPLSPMHRPSPTGAQFLEVDLGRCFPLTALITQVIMIKCQSKARKQK